MDICISNISQVVTVAAHGRRVKTRGEMRDLGIIRDGTILCQGGTITWVGPSSEFSRALPEDMTVLDGRGMVALPGFVDSHTHAMFAGSREEEFSRRVTGTSYQEIASAGGGILSTVRCVRSASKRDLKRSTAHVLADMLRHGTTTTEIKTGYGLSVDDEIKMLEAIKELEDEELSGIVPTLLAAHAIPPEFSGNPRGYVELVVNTILPYAARKNLAVFCDVFCEDGYFSAADAETVLTTARALGLRLKIHADQLSSSGGAALAARLNATSADHLEYLGGDAIAALHDAGTVATLLPGVSFFLHSRYAPARALIDAGVPVAIATDFNPGSCMSYSMPMMMTIACTQMQMSPEEALTASTLNAAAALDCSDRCGSLEPGKQADILLATVPDYRFLAYHFGVNHVRSVIKNGTLLEL